MTGIVEVARRAGVSVATVSRALRGLPGVSATTREAVRAVAVELGYVPSPSAAGLPTGRTGAVGVVSPDTHGWYFQTVADAAGTTLSASGYDMLRYGLTNVETSRRTVVDTQLLRKRVDGLILVSLPLRDDEVAAMLAMRRPVVMVGPVVPGLRTVRIDDVAVGRVATSHLISLGHTDIAFLGGDPDDQLGFPVSPDRRAGFEQVLVDAGVQPDPRRVVSAKFTAQSGWEAYRTLKCRGPLPTAVFASSDEVAMGFAAAARADGVRVPDDLSLIGVDDHELSWTFGLTTVAQPVRDQGRIAAEAVIDQMGDNGDRFAEVITVPTRLIVRDTTAPPPR